MGEPSTLRGWIEREIKREETALDPTIAQRLLRRVPAEQMKTWLSELLIKEVDHVRRELSRADEQNTFASFIKHHDPTPRQQQRERLLGKQSDTDRFAQLLRRKFALGDGRRVTWSDATADDHRTRAVFLSLQRQGIDDTIARHEHAATFLEQHGYACLRDAGEKAVELFSEKVAA